MTQSESYFARFPRTLFFLLNFLSFVLLTILVFRIHGDALFYRYDGTFILSVAKNQRDWMGLAPVLDLDFLKAVGDLRFPTFTRLIPGYALGSLYAGGGVHPAGSIAVFALELFAATIYLCWRLGAPVRVAVGAAWLVCLLTLPYFMPAASYTRLWGNPQIATAIAWTAVAVGLFIGVGRGGSAADALRGAAIFLLFAATVLTQPIAAIMAVPISAAFCLYAIAVARGRSERRRKVAVSLCVLAALAAGLAPYLYELYVFTQVTFFWQDLETVTMGWRDFTFFMHRHEAGGLIGTAFPTLALGGAAFHGFSARSAFRNPARLFLAFVALLALTAFAGSLSPVWRGPPLGYFDMFALPLYGLFGALALGAIARFAVPALNAIPGLAIRVDAKLATTLSATAIVLLPWIAFVLAVPPYTKPLFRNVNPFSWPPQQTPITQALERDIRLADGAPFRGRAVNLAGAQGQYTNAFHNQHAYDAGNLFYSGNEHRMYGLWYFDIPTLTTSNQFMSPYYFLVTARFLNPRDAMFPRAQVQLTRYDRRTLERLGARYVVTDQPLPPDAGAALKLKMPIVAGRDHYLYELPSPNLAGVSPTQGLVARDAVHALDLLAQPDFDFRRQAVVHQALPDDLVAANAAGLTVHRGRLHIAARSAGRSALVLPVEYGNCLRITPRNVDSVSAVLFRANLNQIGVLFSGDLDADLVHRFGPWVGTGCRLADLAEARRLELSRAQRYWPRAERGWGSSQ